MVETGNPPKRRRGRPPLISRDDIVDAVLRHGAEPTLVAIANQLKVTPQALYHHIDSHNDLIRLLFGAVVNAVDVPDRDGLDWTEYSVATGLYIRDIYDAVPGLAEYAISSFWNERILFERRERVMELAVAAGYSSLAALWASQAISDFVHSWVAREHRRQVNNPGEGSKESYWFHRVVPDAAEAMPLLTEAYVQEEKSRDDRFEFTLRALARGLEAQMDVMSRKMEKTAGRKRTAQASPKD